MKYPKRSAAAPPISVNFSVLDIVEPLSSSFVDLVFVSSKGSTNSISGVGEGTTVNVGSVLSLNTRGRGGASSTGVRTALGGSVGEGGASGISIARVSPINSSTAFE